MKMLLLTFMLAAFVTAPMVAYVDMAYAQSKSVGGGPGNSPISELKACWLGARVDPGTHSIGPCRIRS
jgi:hypothetical protein